MSASLSSRAFATAQRMAATDSRMARPKPEDYAHLDAAPPPASPPAAPEPAAAARAPAGSPAWDLGAFDRLPAETRAAVKAGTAHTIGRAQLELAAAGELLRPADVHLHLPDAARYVGADGSVDQARITADLERLVIARPELSRYGHGPGQQGARPDERRHAPAGGAVGACGPAAPSSTVADHVAGMQAATGVKFGPAT